MGIFSDAFFDTLSPFLETIEFIPWGSTALSISGLINRKQETSNNFRKMTSNFRKMTSNFMVYPVEVIIKKSNIETIQEKKDRLVCLDKKGISKTYLVQEIMWSDPETWTVGCVEIG